MIVVTTPLGAVGVLAIAYIGFLFANFSQRLGAVTKMTNHQRWFWPANILIVVAAMSQIVLGIADLAPDEAPALLLAPWFSAAIFHIPLCIGVTINLALVWYYWGWILKEKVK